MKKNLVIVLLVVLWACKDDAKVDAVQNENPIELETLTMDKSEKESTKQIVIAYLDNADLDRNTFVKTVKPKVDNLISNSSNEGVKSVLNSIVVKMQKESNSEIFSQLRENLKEQVSKI